MDGLAHAVELVAQGELVVLTGAGVSTDSGLPAYRDEAGAWKHARPVEFKQFMGDERTRQRYWARSLLGYPSFGRARPNGAHRALAALEELGRIGCLVTQNVDGLHDAAGSRSVIDLHGRLDRVVCMSCRARSARLELQRALLEQNPRFAELPHARTPDGDADLHGVDTSSFRVVPCPACGGVLKPDVVFFGEGVPVERVQSAMSALDRARALLVVGSSLMVFSGYRFARAAAQKNLPICVINQGHTRADALSRLKLEGNAAAILGELLGRVRDRLRDGSRAAWPAPSTAASAPHATRAAPGDR